MWRLGKTAVASETLSGYYGELGINLGCMGR